MRLQEVSISSLPAVLIGAVHTCFFVLCWAYIATYSPLVPWLVARGVTGPSLQMILFIADFLVSVLLCLPAAFLLHRLLPPKRALYLALAVLPGFLWLYRGLPSAPLPLGWVAYLPGALLAIVPLPVAALILDGIAGPAAPGSSFTLSPLRGEA